MTLDTQMNFELIREALRATLRIYAPGRFRVTGSQKQRTGDNEFLGIKRTVQVYYRAGDYDESSEQAIDHKADFDIDLSCSQDTKADVATLNDDNATDEQIQTAFDNVDLASDRVDDSIDELWRMVTQILLSPANEDYGLIDGTVSSPRLKNFQKGDVQSEGDLLTIKARARFSCNTDEKLTGVIPEDAVQPALDLESGTTTLDDDPTADPAQTGEDIDTTEI